MAIELKKTNSKINLAGELLKGEPGGYYVPAVAEDGTLSWSATDSDMPGVEPVNIRGKDGNTPFGEMIPIIQVKNMMEYQEACLNTPKGEFIYFINVGMSAIQTLGKSMGNGDLFEVISDATNNPREVYFLTATNSGYPAANKVLYIVEKDIDGDISYSVISDGATGATGKTGATGDTGATGAPGVSVDKVEVDVDNHVIVTFSTGEVRDAGAVKVRESSDYRLIKTIDTTEDDVTEKLLSYTVTADENGKEFNLKDIVVWFDIPKMSASKTLEVTINKNDESDYLMAVHKRASATATSATWNRFECHLEAGYWTAHSLRQTDVDANAAATWQSTIKKNGLQHPARIISVVCGAAFPLDTHIEIWGRDI